LSVQIAERERKVNVSLPAPLVEKVIEMAHIEPGDGKLADYIAQVLRESLASHEVPNSNDGSDPDSEEIRARLKKLGYL
jgi:hypothetical protein